MRDVDALVARTLGLPRDALRDDLAYGEIPAWDSLHHVRLMNALELELGIEIDEDLMIELVTLAAIRALAERVAGAGA